MRRVQALPCLLVPQVWSQSAAGRGPARKVTLATVRGVPLVRRVQVLPRLRFHECGAVGGWQRARTKGYFGDGEGSPSSASGVGPASPSGTTSVGPEGGRRGPMRKVNSATMRGVPLVRWA